MALEGYPEVWAYRADPDDKPGWAIPPGMKWKPAIHMPRTACRIVTPIVKVTAEVVSRISDEDAIGEGIQRADGAWMSYSPQLHRCVSPVTSYKTLWNSINGEGSFDSDPICWRVEFQPLTPTIAS